MCLASDLDGGGRRAEGVEPLRRDPRLPVDARVPHVAHRRGHRLHGVRSRLRPPRPRLRPRLRLLAAAAHARGGRRGLPSGLLRREGRGRGVPCGVRGAGGGAAGRRRAVAAGGAGELPAGEDRGRRFRLVAPQAEQEATFITAAVPSARKIANCALD